MVDITLKAGSNMRDIFDLCQKHGLPSLAQGMIEFPPPKKLREIASQTVLRDEVHTYRTRMGENDFRSSIADFVGKVYGEKIAAENVLGVAGVAGGVSAALFHLRRSRPDANVALMEPFYTYHSAEVERAFCRMPTVIPTVGVAPEPNWDELKRRVEANEVHGVIVTNPLNPSGHVYTEAEVKFLIELSDKHGLFVIFDECYLDMVFKGKSHVSPITPGIRDNVVACRGFSKCLGCQSWRCGYAISSPSTLLGMMQMMDPLYICTNWTQHALGEYFRLHTDDFQQHCSSLNTLLQENWNILSQAFAKRFGWEPLEPHGTMYGMFRHKEETDIKACEDALKAGVGICPGNVFYGNVQNPPACTGWVRIHCGVSKEKAQLIVDKLSS
jgi:aspartate/methionine/tyrosine aminotransferase